MNFLKFLNDHSIIYVEADSKNYRPEWVSIQCPFCDDQSTHLGYNVNESYLHCWRCGWHPLDKTIAKLLKINENAARQLIKQYGGIARRPVEKAKDPQKEFQFPSGCSDLSSSHKQYLARRGYDPDRLERDWGLVSSGPISQLDGINYKHRIIAPIYWDGQIVSFQGRDTTGKHDKKYMACPKEREAIHHKAILYGKQAEWTSTGICVEGITDVWRFGFTSFATFGIKYTSVQLRVIARFFRRVAIIFDDDPQAIEQAYKLVADLEFRGVEAFRIPIVGDPGGMSQTEADYLLKQIIL